MSVTIAESAECYFLGGGGGGRKKSGKTGVPIGYIGH